MPPLPPPSYVLVYDREHPEKACYGSHQLKVVRSSSAARTTTR